MIFDAVLSTAKPLIVQTPSRQAPPDGHSPGDGGSTHEQTAGDLTTHLGYVILADPGFYEVGDEQLKPVWWGRVTGLAEIGCQDEVLRAEFLHAAAVRWVKWVRAERPQTTVASG
jgi:hypothetical protein